MRKCKCPDANCPGNHGGLFCEVPGTVRIKETRWKEPKAYYYYLCPACARRALHTWLEELVKSN